MNVFIALKGTHFLFYLTATILLSKSYFIDLKGKSDRTCGIYITVVVDANITRLSILSNGSHFCIQTSITMPENVDIYFNVARDI